MAVVADWLGFDSRWHRSLHIALTALLFILIFVKLAKRQTAKFFQPSLDVF